MLSENKSSVTFNSMRPKVKMEHGYFQNANQMKDFMKRKSVFSNQQLDDQSPDDEFDMKSENLMRNYSNQQNSEEIYIRNLKGQEITNFNKQSSEKYIKSGPAIENYRMKKVSTSRVRNDE